MTHAGSTGPKSNKIDTSHSVTFLLISFILAKSSPETSAADARYPVHRRDLTCPFEHDYGDRDEADICTGIYSSMVSDNDLRNPDKSTRSPHHQLRSDPRQALSLGLRRAEPDYVYGLGVVSPYSTFFPLTGWRSAIIRTDILFYIFHAVPGSVGTTLYLPRLFE